MKSPSVLVIGAGVAGLAAARRLSLSGIDVDLVEKSDSPGGHAAELSCKASDKCVSCGACLLQKVLSQVLPDERIHVFNGSRVNHLEKKEGFHGVIETPDSLFEKTYDAVLFATGFLPFSPESKPYGFHRFENVVTALEMERMLRDSNFPVRPSDGKKPEKIGFIQCVGSRDKSLGHLWCSKVCCGFALRTADLVRHLRPETQITCFYMDIQTFGRDFQSFYERTRNEIRMIRSIPGDIFPSEDGRLKVTWFDGGVDEPVEETFDLMVLSVGMVPVKNGMEAFGLKRNESGFFAENQAEGIFVARTAKGPMSIPESIGDAVRIAGETLLYLERNCKSVKMRIS